MGRTVLVVEDDESLRDVLTAILELEGYRVSVARNGLEALDRVAQEVPSVILLDLMMPRMDGYAFVEELERRGLRPRVPIIVVTADGRAQQKAQQINAEGVVEKPFSMPSLFEEIRRVIGPAGANAGA